MLEKNSLMLVMYRRDRPRNERAWLEQTKVIIVGAGAAGIAAGCRLLENGFSDFLILEASNRTGGRIHSIPLRDNVLDMGAQWIHGQDGNPVYEMALKLDLVDVAPGHLPPRVSQSDGRQFSLDFFSIIFPIYEEIISSEEIKTATGSLADFFTSRYWTRINPLIEEGKLNRKEADEILKMFESFENSNSGSTSWNDTSVNNISMSEMFPGTVYVVWKLGGYQTVLDILSKNLPNPSKKLPIDLKLRLGKEVTQIDWSGPGVTVSCSDGSKFSTERVISTVSLNVLKATASQIFEPALPAVNANAIKGLGMATINKIFLEFPYRWWEPGTSGMTIMWKEEDVAALPAEKKWISAIFSFTSIENYPLSILCAWLAGPYTHEMESVSDEVVIEETMKLLRRVAGPGAEVPGILSMHRSKWFTNPYTRGSYSYHSVTADAMNTSAKDLATPVVDAAGKPVLLFAGEATSEKHFSTVHGAIESGWREADRILALKAFSCSL